MANPTTKKPTSFKFSKKSKSSRKLAKKAILDKEFSNLKCILPTINNKSNVDQITILNETVKLINNLEKQVMAKIAQANKKRVFKASSNKSILQELMQLSNQSDQNNFEQ